VSLYFRQLLAGRDFARQDPIARQMVNFVYLVGDGVASPVGRELAGGDHPGQGRSRGPFGDAEQLGGAHQQEGGQARGLGAEEDREDDRAGGELTICCHVGNECNTLGTWR